MTAQLTTTDQQLAAPAMRVEEILQHHALIADVMEKIMKPDMHYGIIPGTSKPTLYQAGAELISVAFRLVPTFTYELRELPNAHREYIFVVNMSTGGGQLVAQGFGSCSTMEEKYRWRIDATAAEPVGTGVPKAYWDIRDSKLKLEYLRRLIGDDRGNFGVAKVLDMKVLPRGEKGGEWGVVRYPEKPAKVENENIADVYNTVGKIAYKRAYVSAAIKATAASDTFTQDVEDLIGKISDLGGDETAHRVAPKNEVEQIRQEVAQTVREAAKEDWQSLIPHTGTGKAGGRMFGKTLGELFLESSLKSAQFYAEHFDTVVIPALQTSNKVDDVKLVSAYGCAKQALEQRLSAETPPASETTLLSEPAPILMDATEVKWPEKPAPSLVEPPPVEKAEARENKKKERNAKALAAAKELTPIKPATLDWRNVVVPFKCKLQGHRLGNLPPLDDRSHSEVMALIRTNLIDSPGIFGTTNQREALLFKAAYEIAVVEMRIGRSPQEVTAKVRELCEELAVSTEATIEHAEKMGLLPAIGAKIWEKHNEDDKRNVIRNWPDFAASVRENFNLSPK